MVISSSMVISQDAVLIFLRINNNNNMRVNINAKYQNYYYFEASCKLELYLYRGMYNCTTLFKHNWVPMQT